MHTDLITYVKNSFQKHFNGTPLLIFSPGRINLIGEHTDYNEGFAFPAAIDLGIVLALKKSSTKKSYVYALDKKEMHEIELKNIHPIKRGGWKNYARGVVGELLKTGIQIGNFEAVFAGNIPVGSGLSSSAALENSFVYGLNKLFQLGLKRKEMILISQKAEHNYVGVNCGIMDQYASMLGKKKSVLLLDCRKIKSIPFKLKLKKAQLVIVNTNIKHNLSESAYNARKKVCKKVAKLLHVNALRDATVLQMNEVKDRLSPSDYKKAFYVIRENKRVEQFSKALKDKDYNKMGALMYQTHEGFQKKLRGVRFFG